MSRAIWKGHIAFGLVEIPVSLHSAEDSSKQIQFSLVDRRDASPVGYKRVNKRTGEEVPYAEIVKGYEYDEDEYVLFGKDELAAAAPKLQRTVEILNFVDGAEIHPAYWVRPYFLKPTRKKGNKAYALLHHALQEAGRVGIARLVIHTREHLAALSTWGEALVLVLLRYAHELRGVEDLDLPQDEVDFQEAELEMARKLVASMQSEWEPSRYQDSHHSAVLEFVEQKVKAGQTKEIREPEAAEEAEVQGGDLLELLQQSLGSGTKRRVVAAAARRASTGAGAKKKPKAAKRKKSGA